MGKAQGQCRNATGHSYQVAVPGWKRLRRGTKRGIPTETQVTRQDARGWCAGEGVGEGGKQGWVMHLSQAQEWQETWLGLFSHGFLTKVYPQVRGGGLSMAGLGSAGSLVHHHLQLLIPLSQRCLQHKQAGSDCQAKSSTDLHAQQTLL